MYKTIFFTTSETMIALISKLIQGVGNIYAHGNPFMSEL